MADIRVVVVVGGGNDQGRLTGRCVESCIQAQAVEPILHGSPDRGVETGVHFLKEGMICGAEDL